MSTPWQTLVAVLLFTAVAVNVWAETPEFTAPDEKARCVVCGMFVAPYPAWLAAVVLEGQPTLYFDGPKDMFKYLDARIDYHPGMDLPEISAVIVTEYYTQQPVAAEEVFFVSGSDVLGPMGHELVPVAGEQPLETFLQDHGGGLVLVYHEHKLEEVRD